jgi:hypothetical protein
LLTAIGLTPGDSSTVHIYTQTIHRTTQLKTLEQNYYYYLVAKEKRMEKEVEREFTEM